MSGLLTTSIFLAIFFIGLWKAIESYYIHIQIAFFDDVNSNVKGHAKQHLIILNLVFAYIIALGVTIYDFTKSDSVDTFNISLNTHINITLFLLGVVLINLTNHLYKELRGSNKW